MHMLKRQCLTTKLGKTAWNDLSSMHVPDKAALGVLHSHIMAQELRTLNSKFHHDTADASQAVTVVAKATLKIKGFVYLLADIIGLATLLQDNLAELHVPIRSGNTPRTKHHYTIRNHLNAVFAHSQTLADIWINKQAHLTHLAGLHTAWQNTRRATINHRVQLAVTRQTINRIEQQAKFPQHSSNKCYQYILPCRIPYPSETQLVTKCG